MPFCECAYCRRTGARVEIALTTAHPTDDSPTMEALLTRAESLIAELQGIIDDVRAKVKALQEWPNGTD